jgi:hypothetical protein
MSIEEGKKLDLRALVEAHRAREVAAGTAHFENIDLNDLINEDFAAYQKYVMPVSEFADLPAAEMRQRLSKSPVLRNQLRELIKDFRATHQNLIKVLAKLDNKKVAMSRGEFWAFMANKMISASVAEHLKSASEK